jgi:hypothetical protein
LVDAVNPRAGGALLNGPRRKTKGGDLRERKHTVLDRRKVRDRLVNRSLLEKANYVFAFSPTLAHAPHRLAIPVTRG